MKRKTLSIVCLALLILAIASLGLAEALEEKSLELEGITYVYTQKEGEAPVFLEQSGKATEISLPATVEGKALVEFRGRLSEALAKKLVKVSIPKSIERFTENPFVSLGKNAEIEIEAGNTNLYQDEHFLYQKEPLTIVHAFPRALEGKQLSIPEGVEVLLTNAIPYDVETLQLPASLRLVEPQFVGKIKDYALADNHPHLEYKDQALYEKNTKRLLAHSASLKTLEIAEGTKSIAPYAVLHNVSQINFSEGLEKLEAHALHKADKIKALDLPEGLTEIGSWAFSSSLGKLTLPSTLKKLDDYALAGNRIADLELNYGLEEIGEFAFYQAKMKSLYVPKTVKKIAGYDAVENPLPEKIYGENSKWDIPELLQYIDKGQMDRIPIDVYLKAYQKYPDYTNYFLPHVFKDSRIEKISILPIPFLEAYLEYYDIPYQSDIDGTIKVKGVTFKYYIMDDGRVDFDLADKNAKEFTLPSVFKGEPISNTSISIDSRTIIRKIIIPKELISFHSSPFEFISYDTKIEIEEGNENFYKDEKFLYQKNPACIVYVFNEGIEYDAEGYEIKTTLRLPEGTERLMGSAIPYYASGDIPLSELHLPDSFKYWEPQGNAKIGSFHVSATHPILEVVDGVLYNKEEKRMLAHNTTQENIVVKEGTVSIASGAVDSNTKSIKLPSSLKTLEDTALFSAYQLTSLELPEGLEHIGSQSMPMGLTSVILPSSLKRIDSMAFSYSNLSEIELNEGLEFLAADAFRDTKLTKLRLPKSLKHVEGIGIKDYSFYDASLVDELRSERSTEGDLDYWIFGDTPLKTLEVYPYSVGEVFALVHNLPYELIEE